MNIQSSRCISDYKQSSCGLIPHNWDCLPFRALVKQSQYGLSSAASMIKGRPIIGMSHLSGGKISTAGLSLVDISDDEFDKFRIKKGDFLFNRTNSAALVGKSAVAERDIDVVFASYLVRFKINESLADPRYVGVFFSSDTSLAKLSRLATPGVSQYNINPSSLQDHFWLPLPPVKEQKSILLIIEKWEESIDLTKNLIAAKQERRRWLMQQLLTGKKRLLRFSEEWRKTRIGDILKEVKRPIKWDDNHLYQLISVRRRSEGLFLRERLYGSQIKTKKMNLVRSDDFLISKMQIVHGASGLVTDEFDGMNISDSYIALRSRDSKSFDINFFNWLSKLPLMYQHALFSSYGVHIEKMTFNLKDYLARHIKVPPTIDEQQAIVKVLVTADREIDLLCSQLGALLEQKKGLMQQLLTGKRRVKLDN